MTILTISLPSIVTLLLLHIWYGSVPSTTPDGIINNMVEKAFDCYAQSMAARRPGGLTEHELDVIKSLNNQIEVSNHQM